MNKVTNTAIEFIRNQIISSTNIENAILMAEVLGEIYWRNKINIVSDPEIESVLCDLMEGRVQVPRSLPVSDCLHVITEPYMTGGHTRLMEHYAKMDLRQSDLLIMKDPKGNEILDRLDNFFLNVHILCESDALSKTQVLCNIFSKYRKVIFHLHPNDIIPLIAAQKVKNEYPINIYKVNHADHYFSYGVSIVDLTLQISAYGTARMSRDLSGNASSSFIGIPVTYNEKQCFTFTPKSNSINFISAGAGYKYKPIEGLSSVEFFDTLLDYFPNSNLTILGANIYTDYWWWRVKIKHGQRLSIFSEVPFSEYKRLTSSVDYYIDSYPIPGGSAFSEQLMSGRKVVGLTSPLQGYSVAEILKASSVEGCIARIENGQDYMEIVEKCIELQGFEAVMQRYQDTIYNRKKHEVPNAFLLTSTADLDVFYSDTIREVPMSMLRECYRNPSFFGKSLASGYLVPILTTIYYLICRKILKFVNSMSKKSN